MSDALYWTPPRKARDLSNWAKHLSFMDVIGSESTLTLAASLSHTSNIDRKEHCWSPLRLSMWHSSSKV